MPALVQFLPDKHKCLAVTLGKVAQLKEPDESLSACTFPGLKSLWLGWHGSGLHIWSGMVELEEAADPFPTPC